MTSSRKWTTGLFELIVCLGLGGLFMAASIWAEGADGTGHVLEALVAGVGGVAGLGLVGVGVRGYLAEVNPRLVARWRSRVAGRGGALARLGLLLALMAFGTLMFSGAALDPHFLGATGKTDPGTTLTLAGFAALTAGYGCYLVWVASRVLRGLPTSFTPNPDGSTR